MSPKQRACILPVIVPPKRSHVTDLIDAEVEDVGLAVAGDHHVCSTSGDHVAVHDVSLRWVAGGMPARGAIRRNRFLAESR